MWSISVNLKMFWLLIGNSCRLKWKFSIHWIKNALPIELNGNILFNQVGGGSEVGLDGGEAHTIINSITMKEYIIHGFLPNRCVEEDREWMMNVWVCDWKVTHAADWICLVNVFIAWSISSEDFSFTLSFVLSCRICWKWAQLFY